MAEPIEPISYVYKPCLEIWYQDGTTKCTGRLGHAEPHRGVVYPAPFEVRWGEDTRKNLARFGYV